MRPDENPDEEPVSRLESVSEMAKVRGEDLLPAVYDELRKLAHARLRRLPPGQTLQTTALVHEAYMKLVGDDDPGWNGRGHFFGAAARAMRNILVDRARAKGRLKRNAGGNRISLGGVDASGGEEFDAAELLALDEALQQLEAEDARKAEIVMLRYFAGQTMEDIGKMLGVSTRTIEREWRFTRVWLHKRMTGRKPDDD
jgi:RNA polymerase sigma factor (TIGR02999 family)